MPNEQEPIEPIEVPKAKISNAKGPVFFLTVRGDSMIGDHIFDGSHVFIDSGDKDLTDGKVYLVNTEDGATLKHVVLKDGRPVLRASNGNFHDISPDSIQIVGRALFTISDL